MDLAPDTRRALRVVVVDDHAFVRDAIRQVLGERSDIDVIGEAQTAAEAISVIRATDPDVVVLDYRLPDGDAPELMGRLRELGCETEVVVLSSYGEQRNVRAAVDCGARAFLTKRATGLDRLADAIVEAAAGRDSLSGDALSCLLASVRQEAQHQWSDISPRETEVWRQVSLGKSNATIASELFITERTVKYHVGELLEKTGAASRAELVALAYRSGLMDATA